MKIKVQKTFEIAKVKIQTLDAGELFSTHFEEALCLKCLLFSDGTEEGYLAMNIPTKRIYSMEELNLTKDSFVFVKRPVRKCIIDIETDEFFTCVGQDIPYYRSSKNYGNREIIPLIKSDEHPSYLVSQNYIVEPVTLVYEED